MSHVDLSTRDANVLEKIKDPEFTPAAAAATDPSLPPDPHVADPAVYAALVARERAIVTRVQAAEAQLAQLAQLAQAADAADHPARQGYARCLADLDALVAERPDYASARNNRAQVLRRLYGDAMLLDETAAAPPPLPLVEHPPAGEKRQAAARALGDLDAAIALLGPHAAAATPVSPQAARTLAMAYTQRAAIYLRTAKLLPHRALDVDGARAEGAWTRVDFEQAASHDLACGGRYGSQVARGLAVSVNPTAKLCGEIVREAMRKEYGPSFDA
ncbi:uncharacterized protein UV8b_08211 [Ustilaginoidea virens]|uniref:Tetratricopeptide repeat protein 36 n=1 Tax=Ustilaginoidea virens TaxID=1159556 RepID=A0A8E5HYY7_USTVR|nr:uncharacterized protein UV8b_08211 [Ustilaginoidea virens]QUC23970.1 hypothetical protein UV8b_08211 [Ustilaginoidea virens]